MLLLENPDTAILQDRPQSRPPAFVIGNSMLLADSSIHEYLLREILLRFGGYPHDQITMCIQAQAICFPEGLDGK